ncbi:MAG: hypothetical protein GY808_10965 [Gammaproteobacteria bacterium]|nr:hypothetical protein [Gammaproteobacteria bacterium]
MPIREDLCWKILKRISGESVFEKWLKGGDSDDESVIENAIPLFALEKELVLNYVKSEIEDSLYFLEKRGYIIKRGFNGLTRVVYTLSNSAIRALEIEKFTDEEQEAFKEALFNAKQPGWLGLKFNLGELIRRIKK